MVARKSPKPTDAELAILQVLWQRGPRTVREVYEQIKPTRGVGYTTVLKFLQLMHEKGLVRRDESRRTHIYRASLSRARAQRQLVKDMLEKAFGGSAAQLAVRALSTGNASAEERAEIRKLLDKLGREPK